MTIGGTRRDAREPVVPTRQQPQQHDERSGREQCQRDAPRQLGGGPRFDLFVDRRLQPRDGLISRLVQALRPCGIEIGRQNRKDVLRADGDDPASASFS